MKIISVRHRGLARLIKEESPIGVPANYLNKIRKMISFLQVISCLDELKAVSFWRIHELSGDRKGVFSMVVSRNWRLTFRVNSDQPTIFDLDLEDYH
jgi:proteic killer suppression protein